jgi:hypothetical protein
MAKDKTATEEVVNNKTEERNWKRDVLFLCLGVVISLIGTCVYDLKNEVKTKNNLKKIISYDIQNTKSVLNDYLEVTKLEDLIQNSKDTKWSHQFTDYDTSVFDAYIDKISLLPEDPARTICIFYKILKNANNAKYIYQNQRSNMSPEVREAWIKIIHNALKKAADLGNGFITDKKELNMTERDESFYKPFQTPSCTGHIIK